MLLSSCVAGFAYIINQIEDIDSDKINNKLHFLPMGIISENSAYIYAGFLAGFVVVASFMMSLTLGIMFLIGLILGILYSAKPFQSKNHWLFGILLNSLGHGSLTFLFGYIGAGGKIANGLIDSIPYFFAVAAVFIGTTIPDIPGDSKSGKKTIGVILGLNGASIVMTIMVLAAILSSWFIGDMAILIASVLSLPFYVLALIKSNERNSLLSIKLSILFLSLAACYFFWPYILLLLFLFVTTRLYYRYRFNMVYPRLT